MSDAWEDIQVVQEGVPDTTFLGLLAHELNNQLSATKGFCELALMDVEIEHPSRKLFEDSLASAGCMARTIEEILAISGRLMMRRQPCIARELARTLPRGVRWNEQDMSRAGDRALAVDPTWFVRVHEALYWLAERFSGKVNDTENRVEVRPGEQAWMLVLYLQNWPDKFEPARLFEPFYVTRTVLQEKGMGLAWWPHAVRLNGGTWSWQSRGQACLRLSARFPWSEP
jgi:hypothetical protein